MHTQRHTCTHTQMYTSMHMHPHTHARTHACTHARTHTLHFHENTHTTRTLHFSEKTYSLITNSLFVLLVHIQTINDHKIIHISCFYELDKKQYHQLLLDYNITACCDDILPIILAHYKYNNSLSMCDIHTGLLTLLIIVHLLYRQRGTISSN